MLISTKQEGKGLEETEQWAVLASNQFNFSYNIICPT